VLGIRPWSPTEDLLRGVYKVFPFEANLHRGRLRLLSVDGGLNLIAAFE
jgi:hypothetical protein